MENKLWVIITYMSRGRGVWLNTLSIKKGTGEFTNISLIITRANMYYFFITNCSIPFWNKILSCVSAHQLKTIMCNSGFLFHFLGSSLTMLCSLVKYSPLVRNTGNLQWRGRTERPRCQWKSRGPAELNPGRPPGQPALRPARSPKPHGSCNTAKKSQRTRNTDSI